MDPSNSSSMNNFLLCDSSSCTDLPNLDSPVCLNPSGMPTNFSSCPVFDTNGHSDSVDTSSVSSDEDGIVMNNKPPKPHKKVLTPEMVNEGIKIMSYAVRGPLMIRANEIEKQVAEVCYQEWLLLYFFYRKMLSSKDLELMFETGTRKSKIILACILLCYKTFQICLLNVLLFRESRSRSVMS